MFDEKKNQRNQGKQHSKKIEFHGNPTPLLNPTDKQSQNLYKKENFLGIHELNREKIYNNSKKESIQNKLHLRRAKNNMHVNRSITYLQGQEKNELPSKNYQKRMDRRDRRRNRRSVTLGFSEPPDVEEADRQRGTGKRFSIYIAIWNSCSWAGPLARTQTFKLEPDE